MNPRGGQGPNRAFEQSSSPHRRSKPAERTQENAPESDPTPTPLAGRTRGSAPTSVRSPAARLEGRRRGWEIKPSVPPLPTPSPPTGRSRSLSWPVRSHKEFQCMVTCHRRTFDALLRHGVRIQTVRAQAYRRKSPTCMHLDQHRREGRPRQSSLGICGPVLRKTS